MPFDDRPTESNDSLTLLHLKPLSPIIEQAQLVGDQRDRRVSPVNLSPLTPGTPASLDHGDHASTYSTFLKRPLKRSISQASSRSLRTVGTDPAPTLPHLDLRPPFVASHRAGPQLFSTVYEDAVSECTDSFITARTDAASDHSPEPNSDPDPHPFGCTVEWPLRVEATMSAPNAVPAHPVTHLETVGVIALDMHGHLAAAGSTGGVLGKSVGCIGDTCVIGSGLYTDTVSALVCSGAGDIILSIAVASRIAADAHHEPLSALGASNLIFPSRELLRTMRCARYQPGWARMCRVDWMIGPQHMGASVLPLCRPFLSQWPLRICTVSQYCHAILPGHYDSVDNFSSVPVLDYALLSSPATRPTFIAHLRNALINIGFLYLSHPPVTPGDIDTLVAYVPRLFALPQESKGAIQMANSQHFLGYSRLGVERTKGASDQREQFDFATPHVNVWKEGDPEFLKLWGPSQASIMPNFWPKEEELPGFKDTLLRYLDQVQKLSYEFIELIAEALGLSPHGLDHFFDPDELMQHRAKIVKYPSLDEVPSDQGVGPHFDGGFLTFLYQASSHPGLQVQNLSGQWIDVPPIPYTFVINIGKGLEAVTQGLARATSHRVLSPAKGSTPRYSIPFFQNIGQNLRLSESVLQFPPEVLKLKEERGEPATTASANFSEYDREPSGLVQLIGRVK
ncbi:hypothetical protein EW146_g3500 [Bondarzewia mesenterica]|uniref:Fe2OG dioxygenase domain-containing protein n=1 Tax=Bondarzewia mesenterica TaxID=1095465 RepID=A0A4S4LXD0_9AGAM|nr:hypothetical protein EW146_g3500 [Bondarzewia mesenterica]